MSYRVVVKTELKSVNEKIFKDIADRLGVKIKEINDGYLIEDCVRFVKRRGTFSVDYLSDYASSRPMQKVWQLIDTYIAEEAKLKLINQGFVVTKEAYENGELVLEVVKW